MVVEQLYTKCLAEAAYYIESEGEIAIIDPMRETLPYTEKAKAANANIKYIFETHFHADFVSGHIDLAKKTGAKIVYGPTAKTNYEVIVAEDNQVFEVGNVKIKVLHTPGHTPESSTYLLIDENGKETAIFTGDTLFLGDVGRPDLAIKGDLTQEDLAGLLFDSLRHRIMPLGDDVIVYPGHGAGSSCGKNMSSETIGTLGEQKETNYALRADMTKEEFVKELTTGILPPPQYFPKNAMMNKNGYKSIDEVLNQGTKNLTLEQFDHAVDGGALILDVRTQFEYVKGALKDALFIGLNGAFAMWVGALIEDINQPIVLICPDGKEEEAVLRLARVGYNNCLGYLSGGIETAVNTGKKLESITSISADELEQVYASSNVIDVRKPGEWEAEHLEGAAHYALDFMNTDLNVLDKNKTYHIHCAGGYRSVIAISLLKQNGYTKLIDVAGGYGAIKKTNLARTAFVCPNS